ncbi:MAG TPA: lysophospholipid acyltransferase family protein [Bacteroidia bacterium]|nr:lysophospholipid acyltransferase family protein [Bacteroidia bacterium]
MFRPVYAFLFWLTGWKIKGSINPDLQKYVMVVAPHTSNIDFFVGLAARSLMKIDTKYVAKKELFVFPFGWIFRALGGYPVDRSKSHNFVDAVADLFNKKERFSICLTPEGTRSYAPKWKTGFYYIALKAEVPIVMVAFNYQKKEVVAEPPFWPSGDEERDIEKMKTYFRNVPGKHPEKGVR